MRKFERNRTKKSNQGVYLGKSILIIQNNIMCASKGFFNYDVSVLWAFIDPIPPCQQSQ